MKSKRKVLLALTINKQYFVRGVVRYARQHAWYLVTDMMYTGRVPLGWRGDGILTILGYRKELADFVKSAGVPTVAITLVNDKIPLPRVEGVPAEQMRAVIDALLTIFDGSDTLTTNAARTEVAETTCSTPISRGCWRVIVPAKVPATPHRMSRFLLIGE